jgi:ribonuclease PH
LRSTTIRLDAQKFAEASVMIDCGDTRVLCAVTVEEQVPEFLVGRGQGWLTAEYRMLPRATWTRTRRESHPRGRTQEIQRLIGRALRGGIDLTLLGERSLLVDCDVLQADGGTRTAAITGAWVAVRRAINGLLAAGALEKDPMLAPVAATSVGLVGGSPLLDLDYSEDSSADVDFNVVMTGADQLIEVQGTAEGAAFSRRQLDQLLDLAGAGIAELMRLQAASLSQ